MPTTGTPTTRRLSVRRAWLLTFAALAIGAAWLVFGPGPKRRPWFGDGRDDNASLHVRVLDRSGPVDGTRVELRDNGSIECEADTNASGEAVLETCPSGAGDLWIEAPGYVRAVRTVVLEAGENELEHTLEPGARLTGRVLDDEGNALEGAEIKLRRLPADRSAAAESDDDPEAELDDDPTVWQTTSAEDGGFEIETLPAGSFSIQVSLAPYESVTLPEVDVPAADHVTLALQRMAAISGRVLGPNQQVLAAVTVRLAGSGVWPPRSIDSDGRGEFRFEAVPAGVYEVRADRGELVSAPLEGVSVDPGRDVRIELSLGPGRTLHGSVREATSGRALSGARIRVAEDALSSAEKEIWSRADGSFEVQGLRWLEHLVHIELAGYVSIEARWGPADPPLRAALLRSGIIRGRVEGEDGRPVVDAELEVIGRTTTGSDLRLQNAAPLMAAGGDAARREATRPPALGALSLDNLGVTQGTVPPIPLVPGTGRGPALGSSPGFRSGPKGEFELQGIPPGEFRVVARRAGFVATSSASFTLGAGATRDELKLVLGRGGTLSGRVIDARRQPVDQVRVSFTAGGEPMQWTLTDAGGNFEFPAVQGRGTLVAQPIHGPAAQLDINIEPLERKRLDIVVTTEGRVLRGRVLDGDTQPVAGARVKVETPSASARLSTTQLSRADGTFEFEGLPAPPYTLRVEHHDYASATPVEVASSDRVVQVVLDTGAGLSGSVVDAMSGDALSGAQLTLRRDGTEQRTRADRNGEFRFQRIARGTYQLVAEAKGRVAQARSVAIGAGRSEPEERFELTTAGGLRGEVVDRLGVPVWNAEVAAGEPPDWQRSTRTDHAGSFRIDGLPAGTILVSARKAGVSGVSTSARVHEGSDTPGVLLRFEEVVRGDDDDATDPPPRAVPPPRVAEVDQRVVDPTAPPLTLGRAGNQVLIEQVAPGSAAERLGLRSGDVLMSVNGEVVRSPAQARGMLSLRPGPNGWLIEVRRDGERHRMRFFPSR